MGNEIVRISVRVPERYRRRLKIAAATQGEGLEEFCMRALNTQLEQGNPPASQIGSLAEVTPEERHLLERYLDLIRLDKGLAELAHKRIEHSIEIAHQEQLAAEYGQSTLNFGQVVKEAARVVQESLREKGAQPPPGTGPEITATMNRADPRLTSSRDDAELPPSEPPAKTS